MDEHPVKNEGDNPKTINALIAIRIQFHLNLALVQLKANQPNNAIKSATNALEMEGLSDSDKAKGYYRRGQAYGQIKEYEPAIEDLKKALELNHNDAGVIHELNMVRLRQKTRKEKERQAYAQMFS